MRTEKEIKEALEKVNAAIRKLDENGLKDIQYTEKRDKLDAYAEVLGFVLGDDTELDYETKYT